MKDTMLEVKHLKKYFKVSKGYLHAVDDISFKISRVKILGLVGESGCGKTTAGRTILRLIEPTEGQIYFEGQEITSLNRKAMQNVRCNMQIIFQDPFSSLDPRKTIYQLISEPLVVNKIFRQKKQLKDRIAELMETVGLAERLINSYPHELDGGRRQRIGIARALALNPRFIVCDEPVSALDVSIQAQILNLFKSLQEKLGLTSIFITHDLAVVNHLADEVAVMYLGQIVEMAPAGELFSKPSHPYTKALLSAIPRAESGHKQARIVLAGELASPVNPPDVCRFAKRCPQISEVCKAPNPPLIEVSPKHFVACHKI